MPLLASLADNNIYLFGIGYYDVNNWEDVLLLYKEGGSVCIQVFDISAYKNRSVEMWYEDFDEDGKKELAISIYDLNSMGEGPDSSLYMLEKGSGGFLISDVIGSTLAYQYNGTYITDENDRRIRYSGSKLYAD